MAMLHSKRFIKQYEHFVSVPPAVVFPLLCPVREYDWIENWSCDVLYSDSGVAEDNCVFQTTLSDRGVEVWVVSRYEPPQRIEFVINHHDTHCERLSISVLEQEDGSTKIIWRRIYTAFHDAGEKFLEENTFKGIDERMDVVMKSLDYYCENKKMLTLPVYH